ncbi:lactase-phlorizin hydrolase-like [Aricia agestis]|uniref:lactase-phlorizin hydrolase-like n=1 Tax=Aricia agestis TaxID=91739 RepID=UPI001C207D26|nr:lactase-phlorizin hydrolase-like [Aricia agestis]
MKVLILSILALGCAASPRQQRRFPDDFVFGTATASYQIEGGWDAADKSENIWDRMTHTQPHVIKDQSNGDIAADSYHNYKRDVEMMRELGLDAYRFSLSWARILPNGLANKVSEDGVAFYNNYINEMVKYGIEPMVTLYHWDLPQKLQNLGGFINPMFPEWFEDYARVVYENFGDRVKLWITFNEPREICYQGYAVDTKAPILNITDVGAYYCAKNLVLAHARAYHLYANEFKPTQKGVCGITISCNWFGPLTDSDEDFYAAEIKRQGEWGLYAEPIFSEDGGFPKELSEIVARKSAEQGYPRSRMPTFTEEERFLARGAADFFGVNHYTAYLVSANEYKGDYAVPSVLDDVGVGTFVPEEWPRATSLWLTMAPNSIYNTLTHLHNKYNGPVFYITENGWSTPPDGSLDDTDRITYYRAALESVLDTLDAGVDLRGYMAWSLMDNFEWMEGYTERFGLYQVDFESPERTRTPRKSAFVYKEVLRTRVVDHEYEPDSRVMTIDEGHLKMKVLILSILALGCAASPRQQRRFPDDFLFGTATASYQIEGGWDAADKGENIWDRMTHTLPHVIKDQSNGDIAADSYHNYKRDVEMMRELGLDAYRFSLSWARILPNGLANKVSEDGVAFYNNYINEMIKYGIEPMVTLYHWDLPQKLQDLGGFINPMFPEWFEDYARVVYENFGDRVKLWITFNEPREICYEGYAADTKAPLLNATDVGVYYCAKNLVLAHARAYHLYANEFKPTQQGTCGITISCNWFGPLTDSEEDFYAAEIKRQSEWGLYAEPIFSEDGGFPKELSEIVARKSAEQGYPKSRMPAFTEEERLLARGAADFFGVNHYTSLLVSANEYKEDYAVPSMLDDIDVGTFVPEEWPRSASQWLTMAPNSIYNAFTHLHNKYNGPVFYLTENGWSSPPEAGLEDDDRITYYRAALESVLDTLDAGVDLRGYMAWSLMDNFEWMEGYTERFGLYQVDFESPERTRTPRKSAFVYKEVLRTRVVDHEYEPDSRVMTLDEGH